ncbi:MAG: hypothetical protein FJ119_03420 [Deltaproteobacteria bacterium]|nr:hypothetical protein [Deltaproteobacteria bacterium]
MKKILKIFSALIALLVIVIVIFVATYKPRQYTDYTMYSELFNWTAAQYEQLLQPRAINEFFTDFAQPLGFPFSKLFGGTDLGVQLKSYENTQLAAATVSLFEVPPGSGYHNTVTLNLLPRSGVRAPVMHVDFLKPSAGVPGMFILDFFNVDKDAISYEEFFGEDIAVIREAMAKVAQYQRTEEQGRGKISRYLDPFKSPYRLELNEPAADDEAARQAYYAAALDAVKMVLPVYLKRISQLPLDEGFAKAHEEATHHLVRELHEKDFAVKMGRNIFKDNFYTYWQDGFWHVDIDFAK